MKWEKAKLKDLVTMKYGKMPNKQDIVEEGYPIYSGYRITSFHKEYLFKEPQLIIVARGVGGTGDVKISPPFCYLTNLSIALLTNNKIVDKYFLKYRLSVQNLRSLDSGAAQSQITIGALEQFETTIPPLPTQRKISNILSAYDDLIENNLKRIKLLEEKAFFNYKLISDNEKKFNEFSIDEVCETIGGGTPSTTNRQYWDEGEIIWFSPTDLTKHNSIVLLDSAKKITQLGLEKSSAKLVPPKSILMTSRATIGYFGLINRTVCTNQGFINIVPFKEQYRTYILFNLIERKEEIISNANGSTYLEITKGNFRKMKIKIPKNEELLESLESEFSVIFKLIENLLIQNTKLREARDILLPRLMNGKIEV